MLGTAFKEALGDKAGVRRFAVGARPARRGAGAGRARPLGPPFLVYEVDPVAEWIGTFDPQLAEEFWRGVRVRGRDHAAHALAVGQNGHHVIEASFKGVARALRDAVRIEGTGRAVDQRHASERPVRAATRRSTCAAGSASGCYQGDFDAETVYDDDPVRVAREFEAAGARGSTSSTSTPPAPASAPTSRSIEAIVRGGRRAGSRRVAACAASRRPATLLDAGVERVVVGTAAVEQPDAGRRPLRAASRARSRSASTPAGSEVAIRGWVEGTGADLVELGRRFDDPAVGRARRHRRSAATAPSRAPTSSSSALVLGATSVPVIASGGVGTLDDVRALRALRVGDRALAGVIVGKAIYERRFTVADAVAALA